MTHTGMHDFIHRHLLSSCQCHINAFECFDRHYSMLMRDDITSVTIIPKIHLLNLLWFSLT